MACTAVHDLLCLVIGEMNRKKNAIAHHFRDSPMSEGGGPSQYRILFTIVEKEIRILRVRGPGQDLFDQSQLF